jgi:hypothetical protein
MMSDWTHLRNELDRVEGRVMDFGWFAGWRVEQVNLVNRGYLFWCLDTVPMRAELRRTILRVLSSPTPRRRPWRTTPASPAG